MDDLKERRKRAHGGQSPRAGPRWQVCMPLMWGNRGSYPGDALLAADLPSMWDEDEKGIIII